MAFRIISWSSGVLFLLALLVASARLCESNRDRVLFVLGAATGGYVLLFYVENYPLYVLMTAVFALVGMLALSHKLSRWWIVPPAVLAYLLHPFGVTLLPAMIYVLISEMSIGRWLTSRSTTFKWTTGGLIIAAAVVLFAFTYAESYVLRFALVPFLPDEFMVEGYWLLAPKHLLDYANLLIQLSPGLLIVLTLAWTSRFSSLLHSRKGRFLLTLLVCTVGLTFLMDPKQGMPRDWDVLSFMGVPLILASCCVVLRDRTSSHYGMANMLLVIALNVLSLLPRAVICAVPSLGVQQATAWFELDKARSNSGAYALAAYYERSGKYAELDAFLARWETNAPNNALVTLARDQLSSGESEQAIASLREAVLLSPQDFIAWGLLGESYYKCGDLDSAAYCLELSNGMNPCNQQVLHDLGLVNYEKGRFEEAEQRYQEALEVDRSYLSALI